MTSDGYKAGALSSSPCFAHELVNGVGWYDAVDQQTARDVARWRVAECRRLIELLSILSLAQERIAAVRLGYGRGYCERTSASLSPRPTAISAGYKHTEIPTVFPQPHDIPMDELVTR